VGEQRGEEKGDDVCKARTLRQAVGFTESLEQKTRQLVVKAGVCSRTPLRALHTHIHHCPPSIMPSLSFFVSQIARNVLFGVNGEFVCVLFCWCKYG
jgi:hypothetical protein